MSLSIFKLVADCSFQSLIESLMLSYRKGAQKIHHQTKLVCEASNTILFSTKGGVSMCGDDVEGESEVATMVVLEGKGQHLAAETMARACLPTPRG